jgi:YbbR domain-containing protein
VRAILLNNFLWKVTAFLLAVVAWLGFQPKDKRLSLFPETLRAHYTRYLVAHPVTITKPATDSREFKITPSFVDITLSGDEKVLGEIWAGDLRATVDVSEFRDGTNSLPLRFVPPEGKAIRLERMAPDRVQVEVVKESATVPNSRAYEQ